MKNILIALCLFSMAPVFGEANKFVLKSTINKGVKTLEVDLNLDGRVDRIEKYQGELLIALSRDTKSSGKFDEWNEYYQYKSPEKAIEVTKKDMNGDGAVDRIETLYKDPAHDLYILKTEVDSAYSGKFDKHFTTHSKISQKKDQSHCLEEKSLQDLKITKLTQDIDSVKMSLEGGFYITDWGYKIHQSCLEKWGAKEFPGLLKSAMSKGFQCLGELAKNNAQKKLNPNGALMNLRGLEYLTSTSKVSIVCNEKNYKWNGVSAHASTSAADVLKEGNVPHPFISINDNDPKVKKKATSDEQTELTATLFHEQLHNLGIRHGESLEFPYACETCCVSKAEGEEKANACKVCSGVYTGTSDKKYLNDLLAWGKTSYQQDRAARAIIKFQKEFPNDRWALFAYADSASGIFSPVGVQMAKVLKNKFSDLTSDELKHLENIKEYESVPELLDPAVARYSKMVAEAHVGNYFGGDTKKVLNDLAKKKDLIKDLLKKESVATDNNKYILEDVKTKLNDLLSDIWLKGYPDSRSPENDQAYQLMLETGLLK